MPETDRRETKGGKHNHLGYFFLFYPKEEEGEFSCLLITEVLHDINLELMTEA